MELIKLIIGYEDQWSKLESVTLVIPSGLWLQHVFWAPWKQKIPNSAFLMSGAALSWWKLLETDAATALKIQELFKSKHCADHMSHITSKQLLK